jgi:predicted DNA-binding transcriptional regulator AlpA
MNGITDLRKFIATIIRPIINEAVKESLDKYHLDEYSKQPDQPDLLNIHQAAELLGYKVSSVYSMCNRSILPYKKIKGSKKLFFSRAELLEILQRKETRAETEERANDYMVKR